MTNKSNTDIQKQKSSCCGCYYKTQEITKINSLKIKVRIQQILQVFEYPFKTLDQKTSLESFAVEIPLHFNIQSFVSVYNLLDISLKQQLNTHLHDTSKTTQVKMN